MRQTFSGLPKCSWGPYSFATFVRFLTGVATLTDVPSAMMSTHSCSRGWEPRASGIGGAVSLYSTQGPTDLAKVWLSMLPIPVMIVAMLFDDRLRRARGELAFSQTRVKMTLAEIVRRTNSLARYSNASSGGCSVFSLWQSVATSSFASLTERMPPRRRACLSAEVFIRFQTRFIPAIAASFTQIQGCRDRLSFGHG